MFQQPKSDHDPFITFTDSIKNIAIARGAKDPDWNDVWQALLSTREYSQVLQQRGVNVWSLAREIKYISRFKGPHFIRSEQKDRPTYQELILALDELRDEVDSFGQLMQSGPAEISQATRQAIQNYTAGLYDQIALDLERRLQSQKQETPDAPGDLNHESDPRGQIGEEHRYEDVDQETIRKITVRQFLLARILQTIDIRVKLADETAAPQRIPAAIANKVFEAIQSEFFDIGRIIQITNDEDPMAVVDHLRGNPLDAPSATEIVDELLESSPQAFTTLVHRAGLRLRSDQADFTDNLAAELPDAQIQSLMLQGLQVAYEHNAKSLNQIHLALAIFQEREISLHLRKLGVDDLMEFAEKFKEALIPEDDEKKSLIRGHPSIGFSMMAVPTLLDNILSERKKTTELFMCLVEAAPELRAALVAAGLPEEKIAAWRDHYEVEDPSKEEGKKKKGKELAVSDAAFEELIKEFCIDYTAQAKKKKFDPMIGHEDALDQIQTIVTKRGRKNPIIIGEPGIGKTKVLEGFATAIVEGRVQDSLVGSRLLMIDLHKMNNTPYIGIFESRMQPLFDAVAERNARGDQPKIMLMVDEFAEAHNAGGHQHSPGFKGLVKPYIASGDVILLGATTLDEYRAKIEKDPALARRLQTVTVTEPNVEKTIAILKGLSPGFASHHSIDITDDAIAKVVRMADQYVMTNNHPDKDIDLLDQSCSIARMAGAKTLGADHIITAVSGIANISREFLSQDDEERYLTLETKLGERVLEQGEAVSEVSSVMVRSKSGLRDEERPIGNFLFVGPTGVGKTELAKGLAEYLFGDPEKFLVRFDMSEYMEKHSVSRLIGSPPGYAGNDQGGMLIKSLRSKPHAVYLYDEVEKAHEDVFNVLLSPFSNGKITDGRGINASMRHAINIMTSNLGVPEVIAEGQRRGLDPLEDFDEWQRMSRPIFKEAVNSFFRPEMLNRIDAVVYFNSLHPDTLRRLVGRHEAATAANIRRHYGLDLSIASEFHAAAVEKGSDVLFGARPLKRAWEKSIETPLAKWVLANKKTFVPGGRIVMATDAPATAGSPVIVPAFSLVLP